MPGLDELALDELMFPQLGDIDTRRVLSQVQTAALELSLALDSPAQNLVESCRKKLVLALADKRAHSVFITLAQLSEQLSACNPAYKLELQRLLENKGNVIFSLYQNTDPDTLRRDLLSLI